MSRAAALLVFLAAAAWAGIVAAGRGCFVHGLNARAEVAPQFAQVIHSPEGVGIALQAFAADAGWTLFLDHVQCGRIGVVFSQRHNGVERLIQPFGGFLVARSRPFFGPGPTANMKPKAQTWANAGSIGLVKVARSDSGRAATVARTSISSGWYAAASSRAST